ncbi:MAG: heme o synthase [Candidatus Bipolaricaulia bacterium]
MQALPAAASARRVIADYVELTKPGITGLMVFTSLAGLWLASSGLPTFATLAFALVGTALATSSAAVFNNVLDRDLDTLMERTATRPLPTGRLRPAEAGVFGSILAAAALATLGLLVNPLSALLALVGMISYVGIYTAWLKRTSPLCTVVGGVPGAIPPVIGWVAVTGQLDAGALALFAILFLWQPPHFWALSLYKQAEYRRAGFKVLPVVHGNRITQRQILVYTLALLPISLLLIPFGPVGWGYGLVAVMLGSGFVALALRLWRTDSTTTDIVDAKARHVFFYSIAYMGALMGSLFVF